MNDIISSALTAFGSSFISKEQYLEVLNSAIAQELVVSNVESFDDFGDYKVLSSDFSHSFIDDRLSVSWGKKVLNSVEYSKSITQNSPSSMKFKIWLQRKE